MTITDYMLKANQIPNAEMGIDVGSMKVDKPLIALAEKNGRFLRISASADWTSNNISLELYSVNQEGSKMASHATCLVKLIPNQTWEQEWKRNSYLIRSRIALLSKGVDDGESHKMKRKMAYKLFASIVEYDRRYEGMQEVILDSTELEATAKVQFQVDEEDYHFNPCWVDGLGQIAGFIMNGNENFPSNQAFINHGWDTMRCAKKFAKGKTYQTYNKMQLVDGTMYSGDTYILEDDNIVGIYGGVKVSLGGRRFDDTDY
jgi:naphtho-gamma-pyrone polyketide synthase